MYPSESGMNVWIEVKRTKIVGRIIGFCPDRKGCPNAMVQVRDKVMAFKLREFRIITKPVILDKEYTVKEFFNHISDESLPRA